MGRGPVSKDWVSRQPWWGVTEGSTEIGDRGWWLGRGPEGGFVLGSWGVRGWIAAWVSRAVVGCSGAQREALQHAGERGR